MRIAHFADVHLDRPFVGQATDAGNLSRRRLRTGLERCLEIAVERGADVITIGGDLWEEENVRLDTRRFVARALGKLDIPVLMICGNHDPYIPGGNYDRTAWPDNVHLFKRNAVEEVQLGELSIWGLSWTGAGLSAEFLSGFSVPDDGRHHLLLIHGTATSVEHFAEQSNHCPFDPAAARAAGFERCLAGHIHSARDQGGVVYPGPPEPLNWSETGGHTVAIIDVGRGVELVATNQHRYERCDISCDGCDVSSAVEERVSDALLKRADDALHLTVQLVGEVDPVCEIDVGVLTAASGGAFAELRIIDKTSVAYELDHLAGQETVVGIYVRRLQARIEEHSDASEKAKLEAALVAGLRALDGREDVIHVD